MPTLGRRGRPVCSRRQETGSESYWRSADCVGRNLAYRITCVHVSVTSPTMRGACQSAIGVVNRHHLKVGRNDPELRASLLASSQANQQQPKRGTQLSSLPLTFAINIFDNIRSRANSRGTRGSEYTRRWISVWLPDGRYVPVTLDMNSIP